MTPDFFIRLTFATHRVADILPKSEPLGAQVKEAANRLLTSLILLTKENLSAKEQGQNVAPRAIREFGILIAYLNYARRVTKVNPKNFMVLEKEYNKIGEFLRKLHEDMPKQEPQAGETGVLSSVKLSQLNRTKEQGPKEQGPVESPRGNTVTSRGELSSRQSRILALMQNKPKVQVWELKKVLPDVTKRTLRRDLDDLLQRNLIVRQGEWNEVFYQIH